MEMCSGHYPHSSNLRCVMTAVVATVVVYAARFAAAEEEDRHLRWRCPVPMSAALFATGQLGGVLASAFKDNPCSKRRSSEPPAVLPLRLYMCVSVTSAVMLTFVLLWAAGVFPVPRCLSRSASCLRLLENLEQSGWITVALCCLTACQFLGAVGAGRSLCCPAGPEGHGAAVHSERDCTLTGANQTNEVPGRAIRPVATRRPPSGPSVVIVQGYPVPPRAGGLDNDGRRQEPNIMDGVVI